MKPRVWFRETRGTGTRETACKPRQDFSVSKRSDFSLLVNEYESHQEKKMDPFAPHKRRHVAHLLVKKKKKEKRKPFKHKPRSLSLLTQPQKNSEAFSLPLSRSFLLLHSPLKLQAKLQPLATISAPNRERRAFSEP